MSQFPSWVKQTLQFVERARLSDMFAVSIAGAERFDASGTMNIIGGIVSLFSGGEGGVVF